MQPKQGPATLESVRDALIKAAHEIQQLKTEIKALNGKIGKFKRGRTIQSNYVAPGLTGKSQPATDPPESQIVKLARTWELTDIPNLEMPTRILVAIARDLDGALRDVRAARTDIEAISNDSDLRAEFRNWRGE